MKREKYGKKIGLTIDSEYIPSFRGHRRNKSPASARREGVILAKCQTVGISKDLYHPPVATYRPSMDIVATLFHTVATYRPSMDIKKAAEAAFL